MILGGMVLGMYSTFISGEYHEQNVLVSLVLDSLWIGNSALGYYSPHETTRYNSPRKPRSSDNGEED